MSLAAGHYAKDLWIAVFDAAFFGKGKKVV
jgi:hypothetical protein